MNIGIKNFSTPRTCKNGLRVGCDCQSQTHFETTVHLICEVMKFIAIMSMLVGMLWAGPKVARFINQDACAEVGK